MYFELMGSFGEAEELYKKELEKDPLSPLILKRMVGCRCRGVLLWCSYWWMYAVLSGLPAGCFASCLFGAGCLRWGLLGGVRLPACQPIMDAPQRPNHPHTTLKLHITPKPYLPMRRLPACPASPHAACRSACARGRATWLGLWSCCSSTWLPRPQTGMPGRRRLTCTCRYRCGGLILGGGMGYVGLGAWEEAADLYRQMQVCWCLRCMGGVGGPVWAVRGGAGLLGGFVGVFCLAEVWCADIC
jgi:hypothetical protein